MKLLSGKTAFITGAASGIGLAMAHAFSSLGMRVVLADIDKDRLRRETDRIDSHVLALPMDVTSRPDWQQAKEAALEWAGQVDLLCNNAGIGPDGSTLAEMDPDSFDRIIRINLGSVFNGVSAFSGAMKERGSGHIVNTASMAGLVANAGLGGYTAAKFAVVGLSEVLHKELAPFNVGVTVFCPGLVKTRLAETTAAAGSKVAAPPNSEGMNAEKAVAAVIHAVTSNQLYALSHNSQSTYVNERFETIRKALDQL